MRITVYSLTRDRLAYSKHNFALMQQKAGVPFRHVVIDNGSKDGTVEWLDAYSHMYHGVQVVKLPKNIGIARASNLALDTIADASPDHLIMKIDNDCEIVYNGVFERMARLYENMPAFGPTYMLSPRIEGLVNTPARISETLIDDAKIGLTAVIGGIFHTLPANVYQQYRYNESLPPASGQVDPDICTWLRNRGGQCGYVEGMEARHYETTVGQAERYPEYFERKWKEEVEV